MSFTRSVTKFTLDDQQEDRMVEDFFGAESFRDIEGDKRTDSTANASITNASTKPVSKKAGKARKKPERDYSAVGWGLQFDLFIPPNADVPTQP